MVALGVAGLNLFFGVTLFLFSEASPLLTLGLVSGSGSLNWLASAGIIGPILFSTSRKVFIFLTMFGCRAEICCPWYTPNQLGHLVPPENVCSLHRCDFDLYVHYFYWKLTSKIPMQEIALWLE